METVAGSDERARLDILMMLMLFLRKIQRDWPVGLAVDELLHFGIVAGADFIGRALRDDRPVA